MAAESYVIIELRHDFDLVQENPATGELVPADVRYLPDGAYIFRGMITEIHFPETLEIGEECFRLCAKMRTAEIPVVRTIKDNAFLGCTSLQTVTAPQLTTIGNGVFQGDTALTTLSIAKTQTIGYSAFQDCTHVPSISIPEATTIGDNCFRGCTALATFNGLKVNSLGQGAFYDCRALTNLRLPFVGTIKEETFSECQALKTVELPSVTSFPQPPEEGTEEAEDYIRPFENCGNIEYLSIPRLGTTQICKDMFKGMTKLKWLNVKKDLTLGSVNASYRTYVGLNTNLCNVICRDGIRFHGDVAAETTKSSKLEYEVKSAIATVKKVKDSVGAGNLGNTLEDGYANGIDEEVFLNRTELKYVFMPNITKTISARAFKGCTNLEWVKFPLLSVAGDVEIGANAFQGCTKLKYVELTNTPASVARDKLSTWGITVSKCIVACSDGIVQVA